MILAESKFALDLIVSSLCGLAVIFKLGSTNQFKASAFNGAGNASEGYVDSVQLN